MATSSTFLHSSHSVAKTLNIEVPRISLIPFVLPALVTASGIALTTISFIPLEATRIFTNANWIVRRSIEILKFGTFPKIAGCILTLVGGLLLYKARADYRIKTSNQEKNLSSILGRKLQTLLKDDEMFAIHFLSQRKMSIFSLSFNPLTSWHEDKPGSLNSCFEFAKTTLRKGKPDRKFVTLDILTARLSQQT